MSKDERDLVEVLKFELEFLEKGGYGRSPRESWRPLYIFEDSPTCMNYHCKENPGPCSDCVLMQLVPPELRFGKSPCRQIPLNASGETLDSLYRYGDDHEIADTVRTWLRTTIAQLEAQRSVPRDDSGSLPSSGEATRGTPMHQNLHPKCANPACPTAFHWRHGGKFFRFRPDSGGARPGGLATNPATHCSEVKHFWLCERCAQVFTLVYEEEFGVVLKLLRVEPPLTEGRRELPAA